MSADSAFAKILRWIGIILMALTAGFTLLGGIGTSCVALNPTGFGDSMAKLERFQWLYVLFVLIGIALGVLGIRATVGLIKGKEKSYRDALVVLVCGVVIGAIHILVSRAFRGGSMPVDPIVYVTVLTLILFLIFRIPAIWKGVDFTRGSTQSNRPAGGAAAILLGISALTVQVLMGPSHTWGGVNYADAFNGMMTGIGVACLVVGIMVMVKFGVNYKRKSLRFNPKENS